MTGGMVIVCAFDPVDELQDRSGVMLVEPELAHRLVAEHRVELVMDNNNQALRFCPGSSANDAARDALRERRRAAGVAAPRKSRQVAKLES